MRYSVANLGDLVFTPAGNANGLGYASFNFKVRDDGGVADGGQDTDQSANTLTVNVTSVNDAPAGTDGSVTILEDGSHSFAAADFGFTDPNDTPANNFAAVKITSLPGAGSLTYQSNPVSVGDEISVANLGDLVFTPAGNANGLGYASFNFKVRDDGGVADGGQDTDQSANTLTVNVTSVNDAPSFTKGANQTVNEDAGAQSVSGWATAISAGPANESGQGVNFIVSNDNNGLFSTQPFVAANGTLTYTPAANANGSATVSVQIHDNGGTTNGGVDTSGTQTFTISVNPVNDAPSFTKGANQTVNEDAGAQSVSGWATAISAGPANESGQGVNFIVSNDNNGLFSTQPFVAANGTLTYTPAANANGSATVSVQIHDNGGTTNGGVDTSGTQTFTISVNPVNDAPSANGVTTSTDEDTAVSIGLSGSDIESCNLTFSIVSGPSSGSLGSMTNAPCTPGVPNTDVASVTYTPSLNFNGSDSFTYRVTDTGDPAGCSSAPCSVALNSSTATVSITVNPVNDAPTLSVISGPTPVDESTSTARTYSFTIADVDSASFSYVATYPSCGTKGTLTGAPSITGNTGSFTCIFPDGNTTSAVSVKVTDGTDPSTVSSKTVTVNNVAPSITSLIATGGSGAACLSGNSVSLGFAWSDPAGTNDTYSYNVDWGDGSLHALASSVTSPVSGLSHSYTAGSYTISVTVSDEDGGASAAATTPVSFQYNVTGVLQPVNDTQAHQDPSVFKYGSTIPVKVRITDCLGNAVANLAPQIAVKKIAGSIPPSGVDEAITSTSGADSGTTMRYDGSGQYIYNLATKSLSDNTATYEIRITGPFTTVTAQFGTKNK